MNKIEQAQDILRQLELPKEAQNKISALSFLALCNIGPYDTWSSAERQSLTLSKDIMDFINRKYQIEYKANTRESFRKNALKPFVEYGIAELNPDNPKLPLTSSLTHYAVASPVLDAVRKYQTSDWDTLLERFKRLRSQDFNQKRDIIIKELQISGYKSIAQDKIELGRINVFIGANGCGKTNILEALATVGAERAKDLSFEGLYSRGVRIARPDLVASSFLDSSQRSKIDIDLNFSHDNGTEYYRCSLTPANPADVYTKWINLAEEELYPDQLLNYFLKITQKNPGISGDELVKRANGLISSKGLTQERFFDSFVSDYAIFDLNTRALRGITAADSKKTPLGLNGEGLDILIASFNKEEKSELNKCLIFFEWLSGIVADKDDKLKSTGLKPGRSTSTLYFQDRFMNKENNTFSAENSNEGVLHVLFYLALFISNKTPSLLGIDNIETALNPKLCRVLMTELIKLAKSNNKQALITTHNPAILDGLNLLDDEQRLFEVYRDSQGTTKTRRIKFKPDLSDKKYKLSEMWLKGVLGATPKNF